MRSEQHGYSESPGAPQSGLPGRIRPSGVRHLRENNVKGADARGIILIPDNSLNGLSIVSGRFLAISLCAVFGLHGSAAVNEFMNGLKEHEDDDN